MIAPRPPLAAATLRHIAAEADAAWRQGATELRIVFTRSGRAVLLRCFVASSIAVETTDDDGDSGEAA